MNGQVVGHEAFRSQVARNLVIAGNTDRTELPDATLELFGVSPKQDATPLPSSYPSLTEGFNTKKAGLYTITPLEAQWVLNYRNTENRKLNKNYVDFISDSVLKEGYKVTGESIIFNDRGILVDGQHRLAVAARLVIPITSLVVFSVENGSEFFAGKGKARKDYEILEIKNVENARKITPILKALHGLVRYSCLSNNPIEGTSFSSPCWTVSNTGTKRRPPNSYELYLFYLDNENVQESYKKCETILKSKIPGCNLMVPLHYWFSRNIDMAIADNFICYFEKLLDNPVPSSHPAYQLIEVLKQIRYNEKEPFGRKNNRVALSNLISEAYLLAWKNYFLDSTLRVDLTDTDSVLYGRKGHPGGSRLFKYITTLHSYMRLLTCRRYPPTFSVIDENFKNEAIEKLSLKNRKFRKIEEKHFC